ncbi:MAG: NAD(P)-dependent oxidoreductase [Marinicellaceae bacterium]
MAHEKCDNNHFDDLHKPLNLQQAIAESARCLYCYDAPCIQACPTSIDIPTFIHQIRSDNPIGAAHTILSENIMGGTCARACPTEVLCEQVCVLNTSIEQPIEIGLLQRHAVDTLIDKNTKHPFTRKPSTGKSIAIVGAGPAGLACAHRLSMLGNNVTVFESKPKSGGLNEYGLASYKMNNDWAQTEVDFIKDIGGIDIKHDQNITSLDKLSDQYDAVFIGIGLGQTYSLGLDKENIKGISDAVEFIETIRQTNNKSDIQVGNDVVVIGAGNTAIDAAVQAKKLGAENVTLVYRRGEKYMSATPYEVNLARENGVMIKLWSAPIKIKGKKRVKSMEFAKTGMVNGVFTLTDETYKIKTDMVLKAIGQKLNTELLEGISTDKGKIITNQNYHTSKTGIFAGGDAIRSGEDLTVQAVEDGKLAAHSIHEYLGGES